MLQFNSRSLPVWRTLPSAQSPEAVPGYSHPPPLLPTVPSIALGNHWCILHFVLSFQDGAGMALVTLQPSKMGSFPLQPDVFEIHSSQCINIHSFSLLSNIPWCQCTTIHLTIHLLRDIWVPSSSWLLYLKSTWTFGWTWIFICLRHWYTGAKIRSVSYESVQQCFQLAEPFSISITNRDTITVNLYCSYVCRVTLWCLWGWWCAAQCFHRSVCHPKGLLGEKHLFLF